MDIIFEDIEKEIQIDYTANMRGGLMSTVHNHSAYEIYILEKGERTYIIDDTFVELSDGDVALIRPFELHNTDGGAYSRYLLYFKETYLDRYFTEEAKSRLLSLFQYKKLTLTPEAHKILKSLLLTLKNDTNNFLCFCQIMEIFLNHAAAAAHATVSKKNKLISEIVEYAANHYLEIESLNALAGRFFITKEYLCRLFKKETGMSVVTYLTTHKLQLAREKLEFTKDSIAEIAAACGFHSTMYFCKKFKTALGISPGEYRKQNCK